MPCIRPPSSVAWAPLRRISLTRGAAPWRIASPCRREFGVDAAAAILTPPAVFAGLVVSLWAYKCLMMVIFQNKIIYMPFVPPGSRAEKVADYEAECRPVVWTEHSVASSDGVVVKLLHGEMPKKQIDSRQKNVAVLYFQGGYWTSPGSPSQRGIELDAQAALRWVFDNYELQDREVILWGQSIGAGVASTALASLIDSGVRPKNPIRGLLLETPFTSLKAMLVALYPQKLLPYRYLGPFLFSRWDSATSLAKIGESKPDDLQILILQAGDDEIVPAEHGRTLQQICQTHNLSVQLKVVSGALHTEVITRSQGRRNIVDFLKR